MLCYNLLSYFQFTTKSGNTNVHVTFLLMVVIRVQKCFDFVVLEENKLGKMGGFFSVTRFLVEFCSFPSLSSEINLSSLQNLDFYLFGP